MLLKLKVFLVLFLMSSFIVQAQTKAKTLTTDGAWCWFSDPRAIYVKGKTSSILTGWVKTDGTIETTLLNLKTGEKKTEVLYDKLEKDDHDNPAFMQLPNGEFMAFYAKHCKNNLYYHKGKLGGNTLFEKGTTFDPVSKTELKKYPLRQVTYTNPYLLTDEKNRIYCFGRWTGYKPNIMWSDDMGKTFTQSKVFIAEKGFRKNNRPYVKYYSDGKKRIHIVFTDGHPRKEAQNSLYYVYYEAGAFWKMDGTRICSLEDVPFQPSSATVIYKATKDSGRAWIQDMCSDSKGKVAILYARYPTEKNHVYYHTIYERGKWLESKLCDSGKWFPQTPNNKKEREPHYSGGLTLHPRKLNEVYLSREIEGVFEIEHHVKTKKGWLVNAITENSTLDNVRPYFPRDMSRKDKPVILWMENEKYIHYKNYAAKIKYLVVD